MKIRFTTISTIIKTAFKAWISKDPFRESAAIAYFSIFSLPGMLVVILTIAGYFFGHDAVSKHVTAQITAALGVNTAHQIHDMVIKAGEAKNSVWATVIGLVTIIVGATGVFTEFQKSLNAIWEVKVDKSKGGVWNLIKVRLFSFGLVVCIAFILIVSLLFSALLSAFGNWLSSHFSDSFVIALQVSNFIVSLIILAAVFACMFKVIPDAQIQWRHVWIGSLVTAFLFNIGKFALGLYFGKAKPGVGYGAAGSVILILLWVSYSTMIVFYGAEFTRASTALFSGKAPPSKIAKQEIPCNPA